MLPLPVACTPHPKQYNTHDTGIVDLGARNILFDKDTPIQKLNAAAPKVHVETATDQVQQSVGTGKLTLTNLPSNLPCNGHLMPPFKHTLTRIGSICDADCKVVSTKKAVVVYDLKQ